MFGGVWFGGKNRACELSNREGELFEGRRKIVVLVLKTFFTKFAWQDGFDFLARFA